MRIGLEYGVAEEGTEKGGGRGERCGTEAVIRDVEWRINHCLGPQCIYIQHRAYSIHTYLVLAHPSVDSWYMVRAGPVACVCTSQPAAHSFAKTHTHVSIRRTHPSMLPPGSRGGRRSMFVASTD
eukprot:GHVU01074057.1.p1 GENE.GHVU01074057.1~~GHVU01074057.1.p1  ORF type:complete len:125 (-),score=3.85 GHVU01074057.1:268-642(-)